MILSRRKINSVLLFCLFCLAACSGSSSKIYRVAVDPSWYPMELKGQEKYVLGFSTELLQEIGKIEKISLALISTNWNTLLWGLQEEHYESMLSSLEPQLFNQKDYDFSDLYLPSGPVLVVPANSKADSLDDLKGKEIAYSLGTSQDDILAKHPGIIVRTYSSIPTALADIVNGNLDGALIDTLIAYPYVRDTYATQLKIATPPLTKAGLRLVTLHGKADHLVEAFNAGLKKLKSNGTFQELLKKWSLDDASRS